MDQQKESLPPAAKQDEQEPPHVMCREKWRRIQAKAETEAKKQK